MKKHIPVIVALFMMFIFGYICPTWSTVTRLGLQVLGAFVGWLILVIAGRGMVIASLLCFFALALCGYQSPAELFAAGFGSAGLLQFAYAFLLTGAFTRPSCPVHADLVDCHDGSGGADHQCGGLHDAGLFSHHQHRQSRRL